MPFGMLCSTELADHRLVTLAEWGTGRNLLGIFVALFAPVPMPFPLLSTVVAGFRSLTVSVSRIKIHKNESQHASAEDKTDDDLG
jgi:hypothetical protein